MSIPWLLDRPPYLPFLEPRTARPPGLMPLGAAPLVAADPDFAAQMAERARLLRAVPDTVLACLPDGHALAAELLDHVIAATRHPFAWQDGTWLRPDGEAVPVDRGRPLESLGRMTAEDWCLLCPGPAEYRLVAAVLCFPSRWSLAEKLGRALTSIHAPVPDYAGDLARRVNRMFEALRPERPVWRVNWLVHAQSALHLPLREEEKVARERIGPETPLYLRTERQTLSRLPRTGAVAFGIKTSLSPLEALSAPEAAALARELGALEAPTIAYRSGGDLQAEAFRRLANMAGQATALGPSCD
ncbi:MAG: DUF3445 domain-containing protein [Pseudomonadota bacterium]